MPSFVFCFFKDILNTNDDDEPGRAVVYAVFYACLLNLAFDHDTNRELNAEHGDRNVRAV